MWPCNQPAVRFFQEFCETQWRVGMSGATGLDHTAVLADIRSLRLPREEADDLWMCVRVMERAALQAQAKKRQSAG